MQVNISIHQAALVLKLIKAWSDRKEAETLNEALDGLQITLAVSQAIGMEFSHDRPDISAVMCEFLGVIDLPSDKYPGDRYAPKDRKPELFTAGDSGEFLCCHDADVDHFRALGYTVTRDNVLGINLASPSPYCIHGRAFTTTCEYCAADQHKDADAIANAARNNTPRADSNESGPDWLEDLKGADHE